jgi:hypothetical protein
MNKINPSGVHIAEKSDGWRGQARTGEERRGGENV